MATDLERAFSALSAKQAAHTEYWKRYDGDHPLLYSTAKLRDIFGRAIDVRFIQNWCSVVVDSALDRLNLQRFEVSSDKEATDRLQELWQASGMELDEDDAHKAALVTGESYVIVWKNARGEVTAHYNDPRQCHVFYDSEEPRQKSFAAKWWIDEESGKRRLTLYYTDKLEYYVSTGKAENVNSATSFEEFSPQATNPFGAIPVFHIRKERRAVKSELASVVPLNDAINKLFADMMVSSEFAAIRQRYVISNADLSALESDKFGLWAIPAGDGKDEGTKVGEFGAAELGRFVESIDSLVRTIAVTTGTPRHYFDGTGGQPSGEALIAMEAPLNKRVRRMIESFEAAWREVAAFVLELDGRRVDPNQIQPIFDEPETIQPMTQATIRQTSVSTGLPLPTVLRREGWTEEEIAQMQKDKAEEDAAKAETLANSMLRAQRGFDRGEE
jgi:SPP1 family phage portal protein